MLRPAAVLAVWGACAVLPLAAQQPTFRTVTHTVEIYATVTDARGALVADLRERDFQVVDSGKPQAITVFKSDAQPISVAIMLDRSPSLYQVAARSQNAIVRFVDRLLPADRASLGTFSQVPSLDPTFTSDHAALLRHIGDDVPFPAGTAMWDALEAGRSALHQQIDRRVILIVTDAEDNCSRADATVVRNGLQQDDVMVYGVGIGGREGLARSELDALSRATGGAFLELRPQDDVAGAVNRIADELHRQYVIGFAAQVLDGRTHRIEVKTSRPGLTVRARRSYLAPGPARGGWP